MSDDPLRTIIDALAEAGCGPTGGGSRWSARCPSHEDSSPSLSVSRGDDGRVLVCCHAGCRYGEVMRSLGLSSRDGFASTRSDGSPRQRGTRTRYPRDDRPVIDWAPMQQRFESQATDARVEDLASLLGVGADALRLLRVGYATVADINEHLGAPLARADAWTFPMRDAAGRIVGINTRPVDGGKKMTLKGGRLGLFYPDTIGELEGAVWVVEGASDTAAAITAGYPAVGRPSAKAGKAIVRMLADLLRGRDAIAIGENDKKKNGAWPGRDGAKAVAIDLGKAWKTEPLRMAMPPADCKDTREWLARQATAGDPDGRTQRQETASTGDPRDSR